MSNMKVRLTRSEFGINRNSIFHIKLNYITDVISIKEKTLKYDYNIPKEKLTVFGDHEIVYVMSE